jgi:hypothetical protein
MPTPSAQVRRATAVQRACNRRATHPLIPPGRKTALEGYSPRAVSPLFGELWKRRPRHPADATSPSHFPARRISWRVADNAWLRLAGCGSRAFSAAFMKLHHSMLRRESAAAPVEVPASGHGVRGWANVRLLRVALTGLFRRPGGSCNQRASDSRRGSWRGRLAVMETPVGSAVVTGAIPAKPKPNKRRAPALIDKRFALGRRVKQLTAIFRARLGADAADPVLDAAVRRAAEIAALAEHLRARALRGEDVSPDDVLRMTRSADLLTRRLHLDRHKPQPTSASLFDYLRTHHSDGEVVP